MTMQRYLLGGLPLSILTCALAACAGDPNKNANDAHSEDLKSERKQQENTAENRSDQRVAAAEVLREKTENNATGTEARQESVEADAKLTEARTSYRAKATERLEKADAKTSELKQLIDRAGGKATTASRDRLHTVETQRSMVTKELEQLPRIANDNWQQAKTSLDTQLDILEGLVKKTADEVGKFKR